MSDRRLALAFGLAERLIAVTSLLVPPARRREWRHEWHAELHHRASHERRRPQSSPAAPWRLLLRVTGCVAHAAWLRLHHWRATMLWQDLRYALRLLRRDPGFAIVSSATLALGIGATTAMFSIAYAVLMKPLPYDRPDRLVQIWEHNPIKGWSDNVVAPANLVDWRARNRTLRDIAAYYGGNDKQFSASKLALTGRGEPEMVTSQGVSGNLFSVLGVPPALGRTFGPHDDEDGVRVAMLSDGLWRRRFDGRRDIVGRPIELDGRAFTVVGVMPPRFHFGVKDTAIWIPLGVSPTAMRELRRPHFLRTVARLEDGVTIEQARADLVSIARQLEREYPDTNKAMGVDLGPFQAWMVADVRSPLLIFLAAVAFVLVIACVNVTNLLLARSSGRARELAVRAALGAGRARIVRQLLVESLALAAIGTLIGLGLTAAALRLFIAEGPSVPGGREVGLDGSVFVASAVIAALTTVACGLVPAWQATRASVVGGLRDGGRGAAGSVTGSRTRALLVAAEVALAVVLVVGAGLLLRSFDRLQNTDPGVARERVLSFRLSLPLARYAKDEDQRAWFDRLFIRLRTVPGVRGVGGTTQLPLAGPRWTGDMTMEGRSPDDYGIEVRHKEVSAGYFDVIGLKLLAGRAFQTSDRAGSPMVVVVNQALARKYFGMDNVVGRRITFAKPTVERPGGRLSASSATSPRMGSAGRRCRRSTNRSTRTPNRCCT